MELHDSLGMFLALLIFGGGFLLLLAGIFCLERFLRRRKERKARAADMTQFTEDE